MKPLKTILFYLISFTWGGITSIIGLLMLLPFLCTGKVKVWRNRLYGIFPACFGSGWGFEMGCFWFVSNDCPDNYYLNCHEAGHGLQNLILGPFQSIIVGIPSVIRFWYRTLLTKRGKPLKTAYDDIWFEHWATSWGTKYVGAEK